MSSIVLSLAMRIYAFILVSVVLGGHAASINHNVEQAAVTSFDSIADANSDSNVNKIISYEHVTVIEEQATRKLNEKSNDYDPEDYANVNVKKTEIDSINTDTLPHQEKKPDTDNNSESHKSIDSLKLKIDETQRLLNKEFKSVSDSLSNINTANENLLQVQDNIQKFKAMFTYKFEELNEAVKPYMHAKVADTKSQSVENSAEFELIQSRLKIVEQSFKHGMNTLSAGIDLLALIREEKATQNANVDAVKIKKKLENPGELKKELQVLKVDYEKPEETSGSTPENPESSESSNPLSSLSSLSGLTDLLEQLVNSVVSLLSSLPNLLSGGSSSETSSGSEETSGGIFANIPILSQVFQAQGGQVQQNTQSDTPSDSSMEKGQGLWQNIINNPQISQLNSAQQQLFLQPIGTNFDPQNSLDLPFQPIPAFSEMSLPHLVFNQEPSINQIINPTIPIVNIIPDNPMTQGVQMATRRFENNENSDTAKIPSEEEETKEQIRNPDEEEDNKNRNNIRTDVGHVKADTPEKIETAEDKVYVNDEGQGPQPEVPEKTL